MSSDDNDVRTFSFIYTGLGSLPNVLQPGQKAVISAWDTNVFIMAENDILKEPNDWTIRDHHGPPLKEGREYLLICPTY